MRTRRGAWGMVGMASLLLACGHAEAEVDDDLRRGCAEPGDAAPDAPPRGASCGEDWECAPRACVDYQCADYCDPDDAHACRRVGGLCAQHRGPRHACTGDLAAGDDGEEAVLRRGDRWGGTITAGDLDVVRLDVGELDCPVRLDAPDTLDLAIDFHDARGGHLIHIDATPAGVDESATFANQDPAGGFLIVSGHGQGAYQLTVCP
jgi:hypothetical protein